MRLAERRASGDHCSKPGCDRPRDTAGLCKSHYNRRNPPTEAERIGKRLRDRAKTQRRRAKRYTDEAEQIRTDIVGDRDGWRCFCGRKIDRAKSYPHPRSPTIDHMEPLSLGGTHTYDNVRIAHLNCNVRRGNRIGIVQLALIG